jgi:predicted nuclease of predicted toxin-antitoxin system
VRLLTDEHYNSEIAAQLRTNGHDATALTDTMMRGASDEALLVFAAGERRVLLTNNVRDFAPIAIRWAAAGSDHHGLLFTSDESMPRSKATIGLYVKALSAFMKAHPGEDALRNQVRWVS